jgi:hypothetical protein
VADDVVRPIETRYAGCRFRSRLEARWAVFFDEMRIPWQYEVEGFTLSDGHRYLPDFLLPDCGTWIEVKGGAAHLDISLIKRAACDLPLSHDNRASRGRSSCCSARFLGLNRVAIMGGSRWTPTA